MMRFFAIAGGAVLLVGCASGAQLAPAPAAHEVGQNMAVDEAGGLVLRAEVNAWPAERRAAGYVTPVRVRLRNDSNRPIRIRYESFSMVGPGGNERQALEPNAVARERPTGPEQALFPPFQEEGWGVNPRYSEIDPLLETNRYPLGWSLDSRRLYYPSFSGPRPTQRMEALALEEGVLEPGQEAEGFIYFERIDPKRNATYTLRYRVRDAASARRLGDIAIPLQRRG